MARKKSAKKRNKLNRQRGKGFEYQVEARLQKMGYTADRIYYSGAGAETPFDVQVTFKKDDILEIEAKRTWKSGLAMKTEWVDVVHDRERHIIVFSIGPGKPGHPLKMYAVSKWASPLLPMISHQDVKVGKVFKKHMVAAFDLPTCVGLDSAIIGYKCFVISTNGQVSKLIKETDLMHHTMLEHKGDFYLIEDLHDYMKRMWSWKKVVETDEQK